MPEQGFEHLSAQITDSEGVPRSYARADQLPNTPSAYELFQVDISQLLAKLRRRAVSVVLIASTIWAAAIAVAFLSHKVYRAEALLVPASVEEGPSSLSGLATQFSGLAALANVNLDSSSQVEALALLQSRGFIESFIRDEDLLPLLFEGEWDIQQQRWRAKPPTLWKGYDRFRKKVLRVQQNQLTHVVTVSIDWREPAQAAEWVNGLVARLNKTMRERTIAESQRSLKFLDAELKAASLVTLQEAIARIMEAQVRSIMMASAREEYSLRVIDAAQPPDPRDFSWPNRTLLVGGGLLFGLLTGFAFAVLLPQNIPFLRRRSALRPSG